MEICGHGTNCFTPLRHHKTIPKMYLKKNVDNIKNANINTKLKNKVCKYCNSVIENIS